MAPTAAAAPSGIGVEARIQIHERPHRLSGTAVFSIPAGVADQGLYLWLAGRRYRVPDGLQNNILRSRVYPDRATSTGDVSLQELRVCGSRDPCRELAPRLVPAPEHLPWFNGSERLRVEAPASTEGGWRLEVAWELVPPERYGSFGRVGPHWTLNGAWSPLLELPGDGLVPALVAVDWDLQVEAPADRVLFVHGRSFAAEPEGERREVRHRVQGEPWLTVAVRRADRATNPRGVGRRGPWRERRLENLRMAAEEALAAYGVGLPDCEVLVLAAPLRRTLFEPASCGFLISDRALEVVRPVASFHERALLRAFVETGLRERLERSGAGDPVYLAQLLGEQVFLLAMEAGAGRGLVAEQLRQSFMWLPDVDALIYASTAPFSAQVFNNPYFDDPLRADVSRMFRSGFPGRVAHTKLEDRFGAEAVHGALSRVLASFELWPDAVFHERLAAELGAEAVALVHRVYRRAPPWNARAVHWERERRPEGWSTQLRLERQLRTEGEPFPDPLPERVTVQMRAGRELEFLHWDAREEAVDLEAQTLRKPRSVLIDPQFRLQEGDGSGFLRRDDNRLPARWIPSVYAVPLELDLSQGTFAAMAGHGLKRSYGTRYRNWSLLYHDERTLIDLEIGNDFYLGRARTGDLRRHRLRVAVGSALGGRRFKSPEDLSTSIGLSWRYTDLVGSPYPLRGLTAAVVLRPGYELLLAERSGGFFLTTAASLAVLFPLSARMVFAARAEAGWSGGEGLQNRRSLGGQWALRGVSATEEVGDATALIQLELRSMVARDLSVPTGFGRLRGIEVTVILDGGLVWETLGVSPRSRYGPGVGLRLHLDGFGLQPVVGGLEVAWSPGSTEGNLLPIPLQVYLSAGRVF
jgi:hypothetical protein